MAGPTCPSCSKTLAGDFRFCPHCGHDLKKPIVCAGCGYANEGNSKFCQECGTPLRKAQTTSVQGTVEGPESQGPAAEIEPPPSRGITIEFPYSSAQSFDFAVESARQFPTFKQYGEVKKAIHRGLALYESAPARSIRDASRHALQNLVDLAIQEKVAFVLLAGDLYDGDWKDYSTGIFLSQQMGRLGQHNISVFAIAGNHDAANRMTKALNTPANMTILSSDKVETIKLDNMSVAIHGQSFRSQHVDENLAAGFPEAEKGMLNIGLLHTSLDGREGHANYAPCTIDDLRSKSYQYWALGHVHKQEFVLANPWIVFPGCIQGRHIREGGAKGCVLVTAEGDTIQRVAKVSVDVFRWTLCRVDVTDAAEMREVLERTRLAIEAEQRLADGRPIALRIRLEGQTPISNELAAYPDRLEHEFRALGAEIGGEGFWVERVENAAAGKLDLDSALANKNAFGKLLRDILTSPDNPDEIPGLRDVINDLIRSKSPSEAFGDDSAVNLADDRAL